MIGDARRWTGMVLRSPLAAGAGLLGAGATVLFAVWLPNLGLVVNRTFDGSLTLGERAGFLLSTLGALGTAFDLGQVAILAGLAVLVGLNVASSVRLLRLRSGSGGSGALVAGGAIGLLGVGCSACGVGVLSALLGAGAAGSVLAALPFGGLEFGLLGIGLLLVAFAVSARRALRPGACDLDA